MHIAVIGAGTAGVCAAKHALANGYDVTVFEQTSHIGGTWVYTDEVGTDNFGLDIHTSMYKGLHTNFPKEIMGFPDFKIPEQSKSYVSSEDVLEFLNIYAKKFNVEQHIKFQHYVLRVRPKGESQWEIIVRDLPNDQYHTLIFEAVMVCSGHYHTPSIPNYPGKDLFQGEQIHSHYYRCPDSFKDEDVLLIGAGPSALDISYALSSVAKRVTISHHNKTDSPYNFPDSANIKPDVARFTENGAVFVDGTNKTFTKILYCTGYHFSFPFLSIDCGISVENNYVKPLYKHCININGPTMCIIGLPFYVCASLMFDLQVRFYIKFLKHQKLLPSREEMLTDTEIEMQNRWNLGFKNKQAHMMGRTYQKEYYDDLAKTADIENLKPVYLKIYYENSVYLHNDYCNFRKNIFKIIDDETFDKIELS